MRQQLKRAHSSIEYGVNILGISGLFGMMILITASAVRRYLLASPLPGVVDMTELYLMPLAIFLTLAYLQRNEGNIRVRIFFERLPRTVQIAIDLTSRLSTLLLFFLIAYLSANRAWNSYLTGEVLTGIISFPPYISWSIVTIGLFMFCVRLGIQIALDIGEVVYD